VKNGLASRISVPTVLAAVVLVLVFAWWATGLLPFTAPALTVTLASGGAAIVIGMRRRVGDGDSLSSSQGAGIWPWLILGLLLWELGAFLQHPRAEHPTISSLANLMLESHPIRAVAFAVWLVTGVDLARR
jgi:hypothetical protein